MQYIKYSARTLINFCDGQMMIEKTEKYHN